MTARTPRGRGACRPAVRRDAMAQFRAADGRKREGQGRPGEFLDLFLHQLPARAAACPGLGGEVPGSRPRGGRRAYAGVRLREGPRQCAQGVGLARRRLSGRDRQRLRNLAGLRQSRLAGALLHRRRRTRAPPRARRGRLRPVRTADPAIAVRGRRHAGRPTASSAVTGKGPQAAADDRESAIARDLCRLCRRPGASSRPAAPAKMFPASIGAASTLPLNHWSLAGIWTVGGEFATLNDASGSIAYRFHARDLHLVLAPSARRRRRSLSRHDRWRRARRRPWLRRGCRGMGQRAAEPRCTSSSGRPGRSQTGPSRSSSSIPASAPTLSRSDRAPRSHPRAVGVAAAIGPAVGVALQAEGLQLVRQRAAGQMPRASSPTPIILKPWLESAIIQALGATQSNTGTLSGVKAPMPPLRRSLNNLREPLKRPNR